MRLMLLFFTFFNWMTIAQNFAQNCTGDIRLSTQQQIDDFATTYPNCTTWNGEIFISGESRESITNLDGLIQLEQITGNLIVRRNDSLMNLKGLDNLTSVAGDFEIYDCFSIKTLEHLNNLTSIEGLLYLGFGNQNRNGVKTLHGLEQLTELGSLYLRRTILEDISALSNIQSLSGSLTIGGNMSFYPSVGLQNLNGLHRIETIGGSLIIDGNRQLEDLSLKALHTVNGFVDISGNTNSNFKLNDLENLTTIGRTFNIEENAYLTDLNGLENLSTLGASLWIEGNNSLLNIEGLSGLTKFNSYCRIRYNDNLQSFQGLHNIQTVKGIFGIGLDLAGDNIKDLKGLSNLKAIDNGGLAINCPQIKNLDGLQSLEQIVGDLSIFTLSTAFFISELTSLYGLHNLRTIAGEIFFSKTRLKEIEALSRINSIDGLTLSNNENLESLSGLENIQSLNGGFLTIQNNPKLQTLEAIKNIEGSSIGRLILSSNVSLSVCETANICAVIANSLVYKSIGGNSIGCDANEEILSYCGLTNRPEISLTENCVHIETSEQSWKMQTIDFGDIFVNATARKTFTIKNISLGEEVLVLESVEVDSTNNFTVSELGKNTVNTDGDFTTFTLTLHTANLGKKEGIVTLKNNDADEGNFQFRVKGTVIPSNACITGEIFFQHQQEIDDFSKNYPHCTRVMGNISIQGESSRGIKNLHGLAQLTQIDGNLSINNNVELTNLEGLHNLRLIGSQTSIIDCYGLTQVSSLSKVKFHGLQIVGCRNLSACSISSICWAVQQDDFINIERNSFISGCSSVEQILANCESCSSEKIVATNPNDFDFIEASHAISTDGSVVIDTGYIVSFKSGGDITLNPGFYAKSGAEFHAYIEDCTSATFTTPTPTRFKKTTNFTAVNLSNRPLFTFYPNPTTTNINLKWSNDMENEPIQIHLQDKLGRVLRTFSTPKINISLTDLPSNIYFLTVQTKNRRQTAKVLKVDVL